ncbi:unnamed protein product [Microthlaspi erraticum]|uniref:Ubiquitin-like protease family profile domain-containing protein n=1 Tax=Microthlaspi erraticum TaxID=1685480 RepID=A0A6D2JMD7_9BRAS|nr:unnamed protein product [Microthlaspi erraticum]
MDAVTNLFRQRMKLHPEWFRSDRICFGDSTPSMLWTGDKFRGLRILSRITGTRKVGPGRCDRFFEGKKPRFCQTLKKWEVDIDEIYLPWNVKDTHWPKLSSPLLSLCLIYNGSWLTLMIGISIHSTLYPRVYFRGDVHAQDNATDCGVYCLKFIEYHSLGRLFPKTLCGKNMKAIRAKLAADLYQEINCRGPPERNWEDLDLDI